MTDTMDPGASPRDRNRARAWAVQIHYRWETEGKAGTLDDTLEDTVATRRIAARRLPYLRRVISSMDAHMDAIDSALQDCLDNWRLDRLSVVDRGILRIGAAEMLYLEDIPPKVSIQEGIRLAERYGGDDSGRFVNGVLDALYKAPGEP